MCKETCSSNFIIRLSNSREFNSWNWELNYNLEVGRRDRGGGEGRLAGGGQKLLRGLKGGYNRRKSERRERNITEIGELA